MNLDSIGLNEYQKKIVTNTEGPVLVIAGAGTGKTRVLTARIAYIIDNLGVDPNKILAITFTNKAANEMKSRVCKYLGNYLFTWINTFHSFCLKFLREEINLIGFKNNFSIIDEIEQKNIVTSIYKNKNFKKDTLNIKATLGYIDDCKSKNENIKDYIELIKGQENLTIDKCELIQKVYEAYNNFLKINNILDFNDLLNLTYKILSSNPEIKNKWSKKFEYIMIDEFQDTNWIQYEIVCMLATHNKNIFAVGDPDQSIYSWRGADRSVIKNFEDDFINTKTFVLDQNYRSTQEILNVANNIIVNNNEKHSKKLFSIDKKGELPKYYLGSSNDDESVWICKRIKDLINKKVSLEDIVILYRSNFLSRNIEQILIQTKIPYYIYGGFKFYQRKEIKDLISYLKVIASKDEIGLKRIINSPSRKVTEKTMDAIEEYASKNNMKLFDALKYCDNLNIFKPAIENIKNFYELMKNLMKKENTSIEALTEEIIKQTKYMDQYDTKEEKERFENVDELLNSIRIYEQNNSDATINDYLQDIQLFTSSDEKTKKNCVRLMTVHMAKGLEFKYVFIIGLIEEIFPTSRAIGSLSKEAINEERRIMYVAVTRAKDELYLSSSLGMTYDNKVKIPSRFISEISKENLNITELELTNISSKSHDDWYDSRKKVNYSENVYDQTPDFIVGETIQHKFFGEGVIVDIKKQTIVVAFDATIGVKEIVSNHKSIIRKTK